MVINAQNLQTVSLNELIAEHTSLTKQSIKFNNKVNTKKVLKKYSVKRSIKTSDIVEKYKQALKDSGFSGKGAPTAEQRATAYSLMDRNDLLILRVSTKYKCKTFPKSFDVNGILVA